MEDSPTHHDEQRAREREIVPSELLPVLEGLEEDGETWRAALPRTDNLLRRVRGRASRRFRSGGLRSQPVNSTPRPVSARNRLSLLSTRIRRKDGRR